MSEHTHTDHEAHHPRPVSDAEPRARALEALLVAKGLVSTDAIDAVISYYEHDVGPQNGALVVARAWVDPAYRERLLADGTGAIAELGYGGAEGDNMVVVANTPTVHNAVVCTLCSCYPWPVLGLPPTWYKSPPYRARMVGAGAPARRARAAPLTRPGHPPGPGTPPSRRDRNPRCRPRRHGPGGAGVPPGR